jgi:SAM-dependent methyltransferase
VDPAYGERYRDLYERHWWWRAREAVLFRELDRLRPPGGWQRALDVGCGDGLAFERLGEYARRVEGVEPDESLLSPESRADERIYVRPFDETFRPGHTWDLMLFLDVLEHIESVESAVVHAERLLEKGGVVVVTVPAFRSLWTTHDDFNHHVTRYTKAELVELLSVAFRVERARYFFRWVFPAKLVVRALEGVLRSEPTPARIPPAPINKALYGLSQVDDLLLGRAPIPFGGSVLAVARKR